MARQTYVIEVPIRGTRPGIGAVVAMVAAAAWLATRQTVSSKTCVRYDVQTSGIGWDSWQRCEGEREAVELRGHHIAREMAEERRRPWEWRAAATRTTIEVLP